MPGCIVVSVWGVKSKSGLPQGNPGGNLGHLQTSRLIPASREEIFAYVSDLRNVPEMLGGKIEVEFPVTPSELKARTEFELLLTRYTVTVRLIARVDRFEPPNKFGYRQISGFFRSWSHLVLLDEHDSRQTRMTDIVEFEMPFGLVGALADDLIVRGDIERLLRQRSLRLCEHFEASR